jgi:hypothetical protein
MIGCLNVERNRTPNLPIAWGYIICNLRCDAPPSTLMDSIVNPEVKPAKGKGVEACSLVRNTSGVEGCARVLGWGLGRLTSKSIIHMDLHKPNNKLVSA